VDDPQRVGLSSGTHEGMERRVVSTGKLESKAMGIGGMSREQ
jgi:hypothetical protein